MCPKDMYCTTSTGFTMPYRIIITLAASLHTLNIVQNSGSLANQSFQSLGWQIYNSYFSESRIWLDKYWQMTFVLPNLPPKFPPA